MSSKEAEGLLSPYRVLDLTNERGVFCGKLLGDLGADVIKVEKPGGDPARSIGPFFKDIPDPEKSLFWFAYNTSKRGITLDIDTTAGRDLFRKLARSTDFLIESFAPGYMENLGLDYRSLSEINKGIIMVSITPFGQTGPYKDYKATDIICWALGGASYISGDPSRAPVRISHVPQSYLHGSVDGAIGAMMALYNRGITGEGQHVDVSIQESMERVAYPAHINWDLNRRVFQRVGSAIRIPPHGIRTRTVYPCKGGAVNFYLFGGKSGARWNPALVEWMESEGMATELLRGIDWEKFDYTKASQEDVDQIEGSIVDFFMTHTKEEISQEGFKRRIPLGPVATAKGIMENAQLISRGYWVEVEHPELGVSITYPGVFIKGSEAFPQIRRRAPLIGEHNQEIYEQKLGLSKEELAALNQAGAI